jgi:hypothetical protein
MTAYELYKALEQKFQEDPTAKELGVYVPDNECGEYEAGQVRWRPSNKINGTRMDMVLIDY